MSISLNHTAIAGNLTRDPETKYTSYDKVVCKITIANSQKFKANGEDRDDVIFLDCVAWGKTAEIIGKHFSKGKPIIVEGRLKQENWEDKTTGTKRSKIVLNVDRFHFVPDGKRDADKPEQQTPQPQTAQPPVSSGGDEPPF